MCVSIDKRKSSVRIRLRILFSIMETILSVADNYVRMLPGLVSSPAAFFFAWCVISNIVRLNEMLDGLWSSVLISTDIGMSG